MMSSHCSPMFHVFPLPETFSLVMDRTRTYRDTSTPCVRFTCRDLTALQCSTPFRHQEHFHPSWIGLGQARTRAVLASDSHGEIALFSSVPRFSVTKTRRPAELTREPKFCWGQPIMRNQKYPRNIPNPILGQYIVLNISSPSIKEGDSRLYYT